MNFSPYKIEKDKFNREEKMFNSIEFNKFISFERTMSRLSSNKPKYMMFG